MLNTYSKDFLSIYVFENVGDIKIELKAKVLVCVAEKPSARRG